ncbi:hypothetical protein KDL44_11810 [bacterium]|nr:hypothetical protein [bacterium]
MEDVDMQNVLDRYRDNDNLPFWLQYLRYSDNTVFGKWSLLELDQIQYCASKFLAKFPELKLIPFAANNIGLYACWQHPDESSIVLVNSWSCTAENALEKNWINVWEWLHSVLEALRIDVENTDLHEIEILENCDFKLILRGLIVNQFQLPYWYNYFQKMKFNLYAGDMPLSRLEICQSGLSFYEKFPELRLVPFLDIGGRFLCWSHPDYTKIVLAEYYSATADVVIEDEWADIWEWMNERINFMKYTVSQSENRRRREEEDLK